MLVADRGRVHIVRCADIEWLQSADNYVSVHAGGQALLMRRSFDFHSATKEAFAR